MYFSPKVLDPMYTFSPGIVFESIVKYNSFTILSFVETVPVKRSTVTVWSVSKYAVLFLMSSGVHEMVYV